MGEREEEKEKKRKERREREQRKEKQPYFDRFCILQIVCFFVCMFFYSLYYVPYFTECHTRVFHKSVLQERSTPECPTRVSYKSVLQECPTRVSTLLHKSALQERQRSVGERERDKEGERGYFWCCLWCCQHGGLLYFSAFFWLTRPRSEVKRREEKRNRSRVYLLSNSTNTFKSTDYYQTAKTTLRLTNTRPLPVWSLLLPNLA